jgi:hypothetical protein
LICECLIADCLWYKETTGKMQVWCTPSGGEMGGEGRGNERAEQQPRRVHHMGQLRVETAPHSSPSRLFRQPSLRTPTRGHPNRWARTSRPSALWSSCQPLLARASRGLFPACLALLPLLVAICSFLLKRLGGTLMTRLILLAHLPVTRIPPGFVSGRFHPSLSGGNALV